MLTLAEAIALDRIPGHTQWESALMHEWLVLAGAAWEGFDFNVRLGGGYDPGPTYPAAIREGSILNTQPRADGIAYRGRQAAIVEIKISLYLYALGQLIGYEHLYRIAHPETTTIEKIAVAHAIQPNVAQVLSAQGVKIFVFPGIGPPPVA